MPRLPDPYGEALPIPQARRGFADYDSSAPARALERTGAQLANTFGQVADTQNRREAEEDKIALARAQSKWLAGKVEADNAFADDQDYTTIVPRYQERLKKLRNAAVKDIRNPQARELFALSTREDEARGLAGMQGLVREKRTRNELANFGEDLTRNLDSALLAQDETTLTSVFENTNGRIQSMIDSGFLDPVKGAEMKRGFAQDYAEAKIQSLPPGSRLAALRTPKGPEANPLVGFLPEARRIELFRQAETAYSAEQNRYFAALERQERRQERDKKEAQDANEVALILGIIQQPEQYDTQELSSYLARGDVRREQFDRLRSLQNTEAEGTDNPNVVLQFTQSALDADPDLPAQIATARAYGVLRNDTAVSLLTTHNEAMRRGGPLARDDVKRAREQIDDVVGGVRGPLAILDTGTSERRTNALREFADRVLSEPGENPFTIADDIIARYRLVPPSPDALPAPRFLVGPRGRPDIAQTRARTLQALDEGRISEAVAVQELENLEAIERAVNEQQKAYSR